MEFILISMVLGGILFFFRSALLKILIFGGVALFLWVVVFSSASMKNNISNIEKTEVSQEKIDEYLKKEKEQKLENALKIEKIKRECEEYAIVAKSIDEYRQEDKKIEETRKFFYETKWIRYTTKKDIDELIEYSYGYEKMRGEKNKETMQQAHWEEAYKRCGKKNGVNIIIKEEETITREKALKICKDMGIPCY